MARLLILIVSLFIGFNSCNRSEENITNKDTATLLSKLFSSLTIEDAKDIYKAYKDEIFLDSNRIYFTSVFNINNDLEKISIDFIKLDELPLINSNHSNRVHLMVDTIKLNDISFKLDEFIHQNSNELNKIDVSKTSSSFKKYLDNKNYSQRYYISIENRVDKKLTNREWEILYCLFKKIDNESLKSKNEISNKEWGKDFNQLSFANKKDVINKTKLSIHIYFE